MGVQRPKIPFGFKVMMGVWGIACLAVTGVAIWAIVTVVLYICG